MQLIIKSKYPELIKFVNPELREVNEIPLRDGFILIKNLSYHQKILVIEQFKRFIILSNSNYDVQWDREEIVDYVTQKVKARCKLETKKMSETEFISAVKLLYVLKRKEVVDESSDLWLLFKNLTSSQRFEYYFRLLSKQNPQQILYSLLTFISKVYEKDIIHQVSKYYYNVIKSKQAIVKRNFKPAIKSLIDNKDLSSEVKTLFFVERIGRL